MKKQSHRPATKPISLLPLITWMLICETAGFIGSFATVSKIPGWYAGLVKPAFAPPNWIFGPVWTLLYASMGFAAYRVWSKGAQKKEIRNLLGLFLFHLVVNSAWSLVFFGMENIALALLIIAALWILIALLIFRFSTVDKISAFMLVPYLLWVSFASILNLSLLVLNY